MGVHLGGYGKVGGRFPDDGRVYSEMAEHSRRVHRYAISAVPVSEDREGTGSTDRDEVVVSGRHKFDRGKEAVAEVEEAKEDGVEE